MISLILIIIVALEHQRFPYISGMRAYAYAYGLADRRGLSGGEKNVFRKDGQLFYRWFLCGIPEYVVFHGRIDPALLEYGIHSGAERVFGNNGPAALCFGFRRRQRCAGNACKLYCGRRGDEGGQPDTA